MKKQNAASTGNRFQEKYESFTVEIFLDTSLFCCFALFFQVLLLVKGWIYWLLTKIANIYLAFEIFRLYFTCLQFMFQSRRSPVRTLFGNKLLVTS